MSRGLHANGKRHPLCPPDKPAAAPLTVNIADRIEQALNAVISNPADTDYPNAANLTRAVMGALQVPDEEDLAGLRGSLLLLAEGHDARGMNADADLIRTAEAVIRLQRIRELALQESSAREERHQYTLSGLITYGRIAADPKQGATPAHLRNLVRQMVEFLAEDQLQDPDRVGWKPIETAPTDGRRVLLWSPKWTGTNSGQFYGIGWGVMEGSLFLHQPTHWREQPRGPRS